jgi:gamma-glutamyltranspeptidase
VWEIPPNGQGLAALLALNTIKSISDHHLSTIAATSAKDLDVASPAPASSSGSHPQQPQHQPSTSDGRLLARRSSMNLTGHGHHGFKAYTAPPEVTELAAASAAPGGGLASRLHHNSAPYLHTLIESMRLAFADARHFIADQDKVHVPVDGLLAAEYAQSRAGLIDAYKAMRSLEHGSPKIGTDTVSFQVT